MIEKSLERDQDELESLRYNLMCLGYSLIETGI